jgi:hypothetical protein
MKILPVSIFFMILTSHLPVYVFAQTCSCAGAPLLGTQSAGASGQGNLLIGLTYEFNQITNLYTGSTRLSNNAVERNTQSTLFEINYGITNSFSVSGTLSFVQKNRESGISNPGGSELTTTNGIGDGVILLRYVISQQSLWNRYHLAVGAGSKAPLGSTSLRNPGGLLFNADMQPGSGAWDGVFWSMAGVSLLPRSTMNLGLINSYRVTGTNQRFSENDNYRFGNEFISNFSVSNSINDRFSYALNLRYRSSASDQRNKVSMPNTGGLWLSVIPDFYVGLSDNISLKLSGQIPVYQDLRGFQPTTTYALSASLFINLNRNENTFIHGL